MENCSEVCGDVGASSERAEVHAPSERLCGFVFLFFLSGMGGKEVYKRRKLKGWKERMDVSAGRKTLFYGENSCTVLR